VTVVESQSPLIEQRVQEIHLVIMFVRFERIESGCSSSRQLTLPLLDVVM
jgi:hypothetical protein